jgi:hypothetical protein
MKQDDRGRGEEMDKVVGSDLLSGLIEIIR